MFSWAYLKPQDSYTHHTQTHTHLHTPSIPHWKLCRQALPLISSLPTSADMIPAGLHSQGSVCTCLFVAAVRDSPSVSVLASATQKPNAQLICKHTITEPLFASATRRDKMGKIPHKWLPKSSRVCGRRIQCYQLNISANRDQNTRTHYMGSIYWTSNQSLQDGIQNNSKDNLNNDI